MSPRVTDAPSVTVRVPAKINLELIVGPRRPDGYHELSTVFHAVSLFDDVRVTPAADWGVTVEGPFSHLVPTGDDNLAVRAAQLIAASAALTETGTAPGTSPAGPVHVTIRKHIPVAGGMAGGSADAAATLIACDALWGAATDRDTLDDLAQRLGSDVNFALQGGTAIGSGRGERVVPALTRGRYHWVLAMSDIGLSTPDVFHMCDRLRRDRAVPPPQPSPAMMAALRSGDAMALGAALRNDLQSAAMHLHPGVYDTLETGMECGALGGVLSGSGPTVAFLVRDAEQALDLAVALTASGVASDVRRCTGPVHGAHVLPETRV